MRAVYGVWLAALAVTGTICRAETQYPYELTIERGGVEVRSGPSRDFYLTDQLSSGETIEVYRREPGGWLAIRPPVDSFSLVKRSELKQSSSGNVATVLRDDTTCRVGSHVARTEQNATHVLLHAGELVELLETPNDQQSRPEDEDETWVRIWPPAGEFRWVRADDVQKVERAAQPDDQTGKDPTPSNTQRSEPPSATSGPPDDKEQEPSVSPAEVDEEIVRVPTETPVRVPSAPAASQIAAPTEPPAPSTPVQYDNQSDASEWRERTNTDRQAGTEMVRLPSSLQPTPVVAAVPQENSETTQIDRPEQEKPTAAAPVWVSRHRVLREDLNGLELELAMMVSQEMRAWRLGSLRERVEVAAAHLGDPVEQARAQDLLVRIGEFERLADRANGAVPIGSVADVSQVQPLIPPPPNREQSPATAVKYDGSGWLVPVHATKGTVPPYALLDVQGDVMHYVSPTPGLNLQRYVRKRIGVFGQQGFVRSLNKPHVTAERVVDLDRHLR